jgi:hypothetical protein
MAGENALPIQECPDSICENVTWTGSIAEDIADGYFFYCERDTIVDAVVAITDTADNDVTVDLKKGAGGTSIMSTIITTASADTIASAVMDTAENLVDAGTTLHLDVSNVNTATGVLVQARVRTRVR